MQPHIEMVPMKSMSTVVVLPLTALIEMIDRVTQEVLECHCQVATSIKNRLRNIKHFIDLHTIILHAEPKRNPLKQNSIRNEGRRKSKKWPRIHRLEGHAGW